MVAVLATATGCASSPRPIDPVPHDAATGGQTLQQMTNSLDTIPGLSWDVTGGGRPNIKGNTGYAVHVTVQPGHRIVDGPALVTFILESVWSVREGYLPNSEVSISVDAGTGSAFDVAAAAADAGWTDPADAPPDASGYTRAAVVMDDDSPARERLGGWPGDVPAVPADVTATE
ncbi:hypothetical protein M3147_17560 [Agromyces mediolanus]|uniref:hypothetical protein n=1 Tax=Agromyces mediolanus TaxID=41986 RepID=UPI0020412735|nr:hypothetical protein [Agromyces mediolanus]MCM3659065.1 hypothetical protein [Agromyces mediolanus]